ncbi:MAG: dephospho-CoA kinase [Lachnospiraceae bacterium]|nr:dephospho-CoA kinase [Lachnospiraceae bacterium]
MFVIGITGGVGSGKSLVAKLASRKYNAGLLIADKLGHVVMEPGRPAFNKIIEMFGSSILGQDGSIDRKKLADIVFNNDKAWSGMNSIIHPEVMMYIENYIGSRRDQEGYIILETAIMYETGCDRFCNEIWYVYVPEDARIKRLSENRGYTEEKSRSIIKKQKPDSFFMERAGRIIDNTGSIKDLENIIASFPGTLP